MILTHNSPQFQLFLETVQKQKDALRTELTNLLKTNCSFKTLEIGSGHGDFLVKYAQDYSERFCLGVDLITQRVETSQRKAQRAHLKHCFFLKARAEEVLECQPKDFLWNEVIVLYPDPWPKRRHHKNRLFQMPFLSQLASCVVPSTKIHFETDDKNYFDEVCHRIDQHEAWTHIQCSSYAVDTLFSRRTGQKGYHAVFECIKTKIE